MLESEIRETQQVLQRLSDRRFRRFIGRHQNPNQFERYRQGDEKHLMAFFGGAEELVDPIRLRGVVAGDKSDEDVGVEGPHSLPRRNPSAMPRSMSSMLTFLPLP